jgi:hypothetical protein
MVVDNGSIPLVEEASDAAKYEAEHDGGCLTLSFPSL